MEAGIVLILIFLTFYFLPFLIALMRVRPNTGAILILNLFLGWTLVGWVVALVWAVSTNDPPKPTQVVVNAPAAAVPTMMGRNERKCPHCAELILVEANICKHCRQPV